MSTARISRQMIDQRPSGIWDYVSPSRLNLWLRCPLAFRLRYIDGVDSPGSPAQYVGKLVHAGLEHYYRHRQLGVTLSSEDLGNRLSSLWDSDEFGEQVVFANRTEEAEARAQAAGLVSAYMARVSSTEPRPLAVESTLEAPLIDPATGEDLGIPLLGVVDLVLPELAGPLIADFKTAARGGDSAEIMHELQLSSYAYLFRQASKEVESGLEIRSMIKTKVPRVECHRFERRSARHFRRLFTVVRAYLDELDRGRFVFRPGHLCSTCEHRLTHCRSWAG